jgi:4-hydroxythreonine-4-phosphate dehydrogenase
MKPIALSIGCPCGIGPEVSVVAASKVKTEIVLFGDERIIARAAERRQVELSKRVRIVQPTETLAPREAKLGVPSKAAGAAQLAWIDAACDMVARGEARALVTGPVSKEAIVRSGAKFVGHTEHLQARLGAKEVVMAFHTARVSTSLVTTHLPLAKVPKAITPEKVASAAYWLAWLLQKTGYSNPRIAVCSLNPHAGEGGLFGSEEKTIIEPGIKLARERIAARFYGPIGAESAYRLANRAGYEGVVAMFHDQATIAMKLLAFGEAVNVTLGLPIVRTSVDHGTAYDRAARFDADANGMIQALSLADRLAS